MKKILLEMFFMVFVFSAIISAQTWNTHLINPGNINGSSCIVYDDDNNPIVLYTIDRKILISRWNGNTWNSNTIKDYSYTSTNSGHWWENFDATLVDTLIHLVIKYHYTTSSWNDAWLYEYKQITLHGEVIGGPVPGNFNKAALTGYSEKVYMAYHDNNNQVYLKYLEISENIWSNALLVDGSSTINTGEIDVVNDQQGKILISYYDNTGDNLKVAKSKDTNYDDWDIYFVDTEGDVGSYSQIWVDDSNVAHIAYYDATNQKLKYATFNP